MAQFSLIPASEAKELAGDIRELFAELAGSLSPEQRALSGECRPATDVIESDAGVEIVLDVAGVSSAAVRVAFREGVLLIVGEKPPPAGTRGHAYHLIEREFGRFARVVKLAGAFDVAAARATLRDGE